MVSRRVLCSLGGFRVRRTKVTPIVIGFCLWAVLFTGPSGFSYVSGVSAALYMRHEYFGSVPSSVKTFSRVSAFFQAVGESVGRVLAFPEVCARPCLW